MFSNVRLQFVKKLEFYSVDKDAFILVLLVLTTNIW